MKNVASENYYQVGDRYLILLKEDVKEIKGTQKAQVWTLIGTIVAALLGILAAFGRLIFFSTNP